VIAEWAEEAALTNCRSNGVRRSSSSGQNGISSAVRRNITGSSNIVDLGAAVVATTQGAITTKWPTNTLHCMHASPSLPVAFSWLACCLLAAPCCLCHFTCLLVAVCLPPQWRCAASTVTPGRAQLRHSEEQLPICMMSVHSMTSMVCACTA
jgi:hypothetical protein